MRGYASGTRGKIGCSLDYRQNVRSAFGFTASLELVSLSWRPGLLSLSRRTVVNMRA